jgi:putative hemolysin
VKAVFVILLILISGCVDREKTENAWRNIEKEKCFEQGGVAFEVGTSGGGQHNVCIFNKDSEDK